MSDPDTSLRVLYDFEYTAKDGRTVSISQGEKLFLIKKTNTDWWQVIRSSRERPFYVPAKYVAAVDPILSDDRKSWAVEALMRELTHSDLPLSAADSTSDKDDAGSKRGGSYSRVSVGPTARDRTQETTKLSDSLEKLARQIRFGPAIKSDHEEEEKMFLKVTNKLKHSRSFKTEREMEKAAKEAEKAAREAEKASTDMKAGKEVASLAIGFQNPSYRAFSASLDDFHDPTVIEMHNLLCSDLVRANELRPGSRWRTVREKLIGQRPPPGRTKEREEEEKVQLDDITEGDIKKGKTEKTEESKEVEKSPPRTKRPQIHVTEEEGMVKRISLEFEREPNGEDAPRKTSLSRSNRVDSVHERRQPPTPGVDEAPTRRLDDGWNEHLTADGRTYYHEALTGVKSWKPPRKVDEENVFKEMGLPPGWLERVDEDTGQTCYVHASAGKWFSSSDLEGRVYFFQENSERSVWSLPSIHHVPTGPSISLIVKQLIAEKNANRLTKARSMVIVPQASEDKSPAWPHLLNGQMTILREGVLNRTRITEHGKKVRKNWSQSYVVLTELFLLFFTDIKHSQAMKKGEPAAAPPELSVDLCGSSIQHGDKWSRRKNVFVVSNQALNIQVLIQSDSSKTSEQWYHSIQTAITILPHTESQYLMIPEDVKPSRPVARSKSVKAASRPSVEDLSEESQTKIRARLKKFFIRRPTKESLVKKGIYKDEPMFGRNLSDVIPKDAQVPAFVSHCIAVIESKPENMDADGLYRVSGNLSQVQKIRLQADQNNLSAMDQEEDVHVLTGALKLFFRELKKPLIPFELFSKALKASSNPNKKEKVSQFREIVKALPTHNRNTLQFLLQHLLRVTEHREANRMHLANVAIVFGPTLMWPEEEELVNMAIDLMQQNLVVECLLQDYQAIFGR